MRLYRSHEHADALAYAAAGGQALWLIGLTPARLYDRDLPRLVATARDLGLRGVHVSLTGTPRQHVLLQGFPLILAALRSHRAENVVMADITAAYAEGGRP